MRVALVSAEVSPFVGGGIAPMVRATAQILAGAGHHVDVFTRAQFRERALTLSETGMPLFRHPRIQWHWVPEPHDDAEHWHQDMAARFDDALGHAYAQFQPDLVEIQDFQGLGALIAADRAGGKLGDAVVACRLNTSAEQVADLDALSIDQTIRELERVTLMSADVLLAPSESVFDYYREFYAELKLPATSVAWPGFLRDDAPTPMPARAVPTESAPLELLVLGRLQRFKGTASLVRAVLSDPTLPIRVTFVGGDTPTGPHGSMRDHIEQLAADDARIRLVGLQPRGALGKFLEQCDAMVVPSVWETWGNVGLEALAAARPLIVTPHASLPDMAGHDQFGLVADGDSPDALLAILRRAVTERDRLRGLAGDPALPAHLATLADDDAVARDYAALASHTERTQHRPFAEWLTIAQQSVERRSSRHESARSRSS